MTTLHIFFAAIVILMIVLYRQGFAASKNIRAILFVFLRRKRRDHATLNSCTGWVRHRIPIRHAQTYVFRFNCQLSRGKAEVILLDSQKRELLHLNRYQTVRQVSLDENSYSIHWVFQNATGRCELLW